MKKFRFILLSTLLLLLLDAAVSKGCVELHIPNSSPRVSGGLYDLFQGGLQPRGTIQNHCSVDKFVTIVVALVIGANDSVLRYTSEGSWVTAGATIPLSDELPELQDLLDGGDHNGKLTVFDKPLEKVLLAGGFPSGSISVHVWLRYPDDNGSSIETPHHTTTATVVAQQPPVILTPTNGLAKNANNPMAFRWKNGLGNSPTSTLKIYEVMDGQTVGQAVLGNLPIKIEEVEGLSQWYWSSGDSPLEEGDSIHVAWTVEPTVNADDNPGGASLISSVADFWAYRPKGIEAEEESETPEPPQPVDTLQQQQTAQILALLGPILLPPSAATTIASANPIIPPIDTLPKVVVEEEKGTISSTEPPEPSKTNAEELPAPCSLSPLQVSPDQTIVQNDKQPVRIAIVDPDPAFTYEWLSDPPGYQAYRPACTVSPTETTRYICFQANEDGTCSSTAEVWVTVLPSITAHVDTDRCGMPIPYVNSTKPQMNPMIGISSTKPFEAGPIPAGDTLLSFAKVAVQLPKNLVWSPPLQSRDGRNIPAASRPAPAATGNGSFTYTWGKNGQPITPPPTEPGTYSVTVTDGKRSDTLVIEYKPLQRFHGGFPTLIIPSTVAVGNPDRQFVILNDGDAPAGMPAYNARSYELQIWKGDHAPEVIQAETENEFQDGDIRWDGMIGGKLARPGTYFWRLKLTNCDHQSPSADFTYPIRTATWNGSSYDLGPTYDAAFGQFEVLPDAGI